MKPCLILSFMNGKKNTKTKPFQTTFWPYLEEYTWGEVGQQARKLATGLQSLGLRENAHIGLISKNSP